MVRSVLALSLVLLGSSAQAQPQDPKKGPETPPGIQVLKSGGRVLGSALDVAYFRSLKADERGPARTGPVPWGFHRRLEMKVQVLGTGCAKCRKLAENARQALSEAGIECQVEEVKDLQKILSHDVMVTPALLIDDEVKVSGKVVSSEEIAGWIRQAQG